MSSSTSNTMKAIVQKGYGGVDQLVLDEKYPKPSIKPKSSEVLIEIHAANISAGDWRINTLSLPSAWMVPLVRCLFGWSRPRCSVRGICGAGRIVEVGDKVNGESSTSTSTKKNNNFQLHDRVYFINTNPFKGGAGCLAEYLVLDSKTAIMAKIPSIREKNDESSVEENINCSPISYVSACPLSFGAMSALHFINEKTVKVGQKVLVYGASGAVGSYAIQLAKFYGASEVTAVASAGHHESLRELGADKVIDYRTTDFREVNNNEDNGDSSKYYPKNPVYYDLIFDAVGYVGNVTKKNCRKVLRPKVGVFLSINNPTNETCEKLETLNGIVLKGGLKTLIDKVYPMEEFRQAHQHVYDGHKNGNVVVEIVTGGKGTE